MRYIENIVVGMPLVDPKQIFAIDDDDWTDNEADKTIFTYEKFLPKILVEYELAKSTSEVKRNRPDLFVVLDKLDFLQIKLGKRKLWILVGES